MSAFLLVQAAADTLAAQSDTMMTAAERLAAAQSGLDTPFTARLVGILGVVTMIALAVMLSYDRKRIDWRLVGTGLALQALFGVIVLKTGPGRAFFDWMGGLITGLLGFQEEGARFVFGNLVQS
ncbi:MAG TPA: Na+ dependent nucleoside transporter N-terminal domain-containing protein, partial [Gemmatimonadales bacterium]|nr:Na+ dependent nucleoside transporter N-terminal domain-containing protein [Gemmatimonadales bacterium]